MKLLIYFNILNKNFICIFDDICYGKNIGDFYKINSLLIGIIDLNNNPTFLKITKRKLKNFRYDLGRKFIKLGERLQNKKNIKSNITIINRYPWWK